MVEIHLTKKELAEVAGYTYRRLYDIDKGLPAEEKLFVEAEDGKYDLKAFVQRWVSYHAAGREASEGKLSLEEAKTFHEQVKIQRSQLIVAKMRGELIDINEVHRLWCGVAASVTQNLMQLPGAIAQQVNGLDNVELVTGIIEKEIRGALEGISKTPIPSDSAAPPEETEED